MAEVLLSPGIQITETDRSFVPARPLVAGAAIIGPTVKGPAEVPVVVTSYGDYQRMFGTTFMMNRYKENWKEIRDAELADAEAEMLPYRHVSHYEEAELEKDPETGHYIPVEGVTYYEKVDEEYVAVELPLDDEKTYYVKVEYTALEKEETKDPETQKVVYVKFYYMEEVEGEPVRHNMQEGEVYYRCITVKSMDKEECEYTEEAKWVEFVAPDPDKYSEEYLALPDSDRVWKDTKISQKSQEFLTSIAAKSYFEQGGESLLVMRAVDNEFRSGRAEVPTRNGGKAFEIRTISEGEYLNNWEGDPQDRSETTASIPNVIRTDGSLIDGTKNNIRWEIADVDEETGTFSIYVRRGDDVDYDKNILEAFTGLTLDPDSTNYISRRIGDQWQELVEEETDDDVINYITVHGNYPNISKYIYIKDVNDIYGYFLADGYTRRGSKEDAILNPDAQVPVEKPEGIDPPYAKDGSDCIYPEDVAYLLPQTCEGGFYDAAGKIFSTHEDEVNALFFEDIQNIESGVGEEVKIQGVTPSKYDALISVLENQDEYEINMISVPGLTVASNTTQTDMVNSLAQKRGDLIAVIDLVGFGSKIGDVQQKAMGLNSSYSAAYWPWLQMYSSTGRLEWVPASVVIPGIYVFTDRVAAPWFAPAGMIRGSVQGVIQTERKLLKQHRDDLYKKNVNPIATLPGSGITVYGQKTLQKKATALDRVNVRRLMIELKRTVKNMASGILFEQNDAQLRNTFKANLDQYLESVVKRRGLYAYKSIVEEVNTPDVIDRNEFRCQIYIQPTKVIEFIYIDFTITNTGVDFNN